MQKLIMLGRVQDFNLHQQLEYQAQIPVVWQLTNNLSDVEHGVPPQLSRSSSLPPLGISASPPVCLLTAINPSSAIILTNQFIWHVYAFLVKCPIKNVLREAWNCFSWLLLG